MISVVVPTLWRFAPFLDFVDSLTRLPVIDEIIIINNNISATPPHKAVTHPKVKMIYCEKNIYVNPAWNLGVAKSKNKNVCVINDDIIVDLKLFFKVDEFLTRDMGLVGFCPGRPEFNQPPITNGEIEFMPWQGQHTFGCGSLFFIHKDNWNVIPDGLNVFYGDNWAFDTQIYMSRQNWIITNCFFYSPWATSTTSLGNPHAILDQENPIYQMALQKIREGTIALH